MVQNDTHGLAYCGTRPYPEITETTEYVQIKEEKHMASVETAKESERGIVDMETLKHTNEQLISTLDEVLQIQTDGAKKRQEAEQELRRLEGELKQKLLELRG